MTIQFDVFGNEISVTELERQFQEHTTKAPKTI